LFPGSSDHATIQVDHPISLADQAVHLKVSGLKAGESVEVGTQAVDVGGKQWHGQATFTANDQGAIDLDHASPSNGTYQTVDGMGLFTTGLPAAVVGCAPGRWRGNPQLEWVTPLVLRAGCGWAGGGGLRRAPLARCSPAGGL
jgi:hypothetical protein